MLKWYQPSLDLGVARCGSCGRETEYDGGPWTCQDCTTRGHNDGQVDD